jgi:hypothetical protein
MVHHSEVQPWQPCDVPGYLPQAASHKALDCVTGIDMPQEHVCLLWAILLLLRR